MAGEAGATKPGRKRWLNTMEIYKNSELKLKESEKPVFTKFNWNNIPLGKICPLKSDDILRVLISENDKMPNKTGGATFLSHYKLQDIQELLVTASTHWLLTPSDIKPSCHSPKGLIEDMDIPWNADKFIILLPHEKPDDNFHLKTQEVHQILRELIVGIYVFNQLPGLTLDGAFDMSTICRLPPAYKNTLIGQSLIEVDYMLKCIWLGGYMPKEKRELFNDSWKGLVEQKSDSKQQIINDFLHEGLQDVCDIPNYKNIYDEVTQINDGKSTKTVFNKQKLGLNLNFTIESWCQLRTIMTVDVGFAVSSIAPFDAEEDVKSHLRTIERVISSHLIDNDDIRLAVEKLKLVAAIVPILIALKRRRKIPNIAYFKPPISRKFCMTESELPPLTVGQHFKRTEFYEGNRYFNVDGGIKFDIETGESAKMFPSEVLARYRQRLISYYKSEDVKLNDCRGPLDEQLLTSFLARNRRYHALEIRVENCLSKNCQKPYWTNAIHTELTFHKFKTLPKTFSQIEEQIHLHFGLQRDQCRSLTLSERLHLVASRGMAASFHALLRDVQYTGLDETYKNEQGWSLLHTAAKANSVSIVTQLIQFGLDVNTKATKHGDPHTTGKTALHIAAEYGSIDVFTCLLSNGANILATNNKGSAPIHTSAYFNQLLITKLINKHCNDLTLLTTDRLKRIPMHLSAINGSLETIKWFLDQFKANTTEKSVDPNMTDAKGCNIVHLATLNSQIHVLKYLITDRAEIHVWKSMSEMLLSTTDEWRIASVRCIRLLSEESNYLNGIVKADLQSTLVGLLQDVAIIQPHVVATLSQMSSHLKVQQALRNPKLIHVLVKLLSCGDDVTAAQSGSIIGDVAVDDHSKGVVGAKGGIEVLGDLLANPSKSSLILSALKAMSSVCNGHLENQDRIASTDTVIPRLVNLLVVQSDVIRCKTCSTLVVVARSHLVNQSSIIDAGGVKHVRYLLLIRNPILQKQSAELLRELVMNNPTNQARLLEMDVLQPTISMLKGSDVELKEVAADAIWAMAGSGTAQRKLVAQKIGTNSLINMLLTRSQVLVCTSCPLIAAIVYEVPAQQSKFLEEGGVNPLIRMLQDKQSPSIVLIAIFRTLSTLCLGAAYSGHTGVQDELENQGVVACLLEMIGESTLSDPEVEVEALHVLTCAVLRHKNNMKTLKTRKFTLQDYVGKHLIVGDESIRVSAAMSLALFVLNKNTDWTQLRSKLQLKLEFFKKLLESNNECNQCFAAFQTCVLAPLVSDADDASCIVIGVQLLAKKIANNVKNELRTFLYSQCLLSAVGGFSDAIVSLGVIDVLMSVLLSPDTANIRPTCASTLAALSRHQCGRMKMASLCRRNPEFYRCLVENLPETVELCPKFKFN